MATITFIKDVSNRWTNNTLYKAGDVCSVLSDKQVTNLANHGFCVLEQENNLDFDALKSIATDEVIAYASEHNINLNTVKGTGKNGRILMKDVKVLG